MPIKAEEQTLLSRTARLRKAALVCTCNNSHLQSLPFPEAAASEVVFQGYFVLSHKTGRLPLESLPVTCSPLGERQPPGRVVQVGTECVSA